VDVRARIRHVYRYGLAALLVFALGACRQIAGIEDLEAPGDGGKGSADQSVLDGPGCSSQGSTVLARDSEKPQSLLVVGNSVYWLDPGSSEGNDGRLMSVSVEGGRPVELAGNLASPLSLTTDGSSLYFYETGAANIDKLVIGTTVVKNLASGLSFDSFDNGWIPPSTMNPNLGLPDTTILAVAQGYVFFPMGLGSDASDIEEFTLARVSTEGGPVEEVLGSLLPGDASGGVVDADFLPDSGDTAQVNPFAFAVQDGSVYWLNAGGGIAVDGSDYSLWKVPVSGGAPAMVSSGLSEPVNLVLSGTTLYLVDSRNDDVEAVPTAGGSAMPVASGQKGPWAMAQNGGFIYWSNLGAGNDGGSIARLAVGDKGNSAVVVAHLAAPAAIAVDDKNVYWVDTVCDAVFKAPK
jgi:hypothetical protein